MEEIKQYQSKGYRVLAYGTRILDDKMASNLNDILNLNREDVEKENSFQFLGIVVMDNQLKPKTKSVLNELKENKIRQIMATGDNIHTAIWVAKKC